MKAWKSLTFSSFGFLRWKSNDLKLALGYDFQTSLQPGRLGYPTIYIYIYIYTSGVFRAARVQAVEGNASIQKSGRPRLASSTRRNSLWKNRCLVMVPWQRSVDAYVADGYCVSLDFGNDPVILGRIYFECSQISYTRTIEFRFSTL